MTVLSDPALGRLRRLCCNSPAPTNGVACRHGMARRGRVGPSPPASFSGRRAIALAELASIGGRAVVLGFDQLDSLAPRSFRLSSSSSAHLSTTPETCS